MDGRALALLLDADECIYNKYYRIILLYLIKNHHDYFKSHHQLTPKTAQDIFDRKEKIRQIKAELALLDLHSEEGCSHLETELHQYFASKEAKEKLQLTEVLKYSELALNHFFPYFKSLDSDGDDLMTEVLYLANKNLFEKVMSSMQKDHIKYLILFIFSARQSYNIDFFNSLENGTGLFMYDIKLIENKFNTLLNEEKPGRCCDTCYLTTADSHHNLSPGTAHKQVMTGCNSDKNITYFETIYDNTKFTIVYNILQCFAGILPHLCHGSPRANVWVMDDLIIIHEVLPPIFANNKGIFSKSLTLEFMPYDGKFFSVAAGENNTTPVINGTNEFRDNDYQKTLQSIHQKCRHFNDRADVMDSATQLPSDYYAKLIAAINLSGSLAQKPPELKISDKPASFFMMTDDVNTPLKKSRPMNFSDYHDNNTSDDENRRSDVNSLEMATIDLSR